MYMSPFDNLKHVAQKIKFDSAQDTAVGLQSHFLDDPMVRAHLVLTCSLCDDENNNNNKEV